MDHTILAEGLTAEPSPRLLFWSALATSFLALVAFAVAATTPPRTGPFAAAGTALPYPYLGVGRFVPRDFIWMYLSLLMLLAYLLLSACLAGQASGRARPWGLFGFGLAATAFAVLAIDYFVQIYTIQPALLAGEGADVVAVSQYNPHGLFIALENLGYLAMALSLGAFAITFRAARLRTTVRVVLGLTAILAVVALVVMSFAFGLGLEYRFEVAIISIDYAALVAGGALIAASARRATRSP